MSIACSRARLCALTHKLLNLLRRIWRDVFVVGKRVQQSPHANRNASMSPAKCVCTYPLLVFTYDFCCLIKARSAYGTVGFTAITNPGYSMHQVLQSRTRAGWH